MSLLSQQSQVNADTAFFAPASGGGGGGGGGSGGNLVVSSITFNGQIASPIEEDIQFPGGYTGTVLADQFQIKSGTNDNLVFFDAENINMSITDNTNTVQIGLDVSGALTFLSNPAAAPPRIKLLSPTIASSMTISSINGAQYPPAPTDVFSSITVSSINGAQYPPAEPTALSLSTLTMNTNGYIDAPAVNGSLRIQEYTSGSQGSQIEYISSGINCAALNFGVSTLEAVQADFTVSSINSQQPVGTFAGQQMPGGFQAGYVSQLPYGSTVLFAHPYSDDKVSVLLTATNAGVSGGPNPDISLNAGYGTNGVSSVGFAVDMRNNGVGFTGDFYWMAFPWTS